MWLPGIQTIIAVILLIIGTVVITHSATVVVVKKKDGKTYASKHWGYIALGAVLVIIGLFIIWRVVNYYRKNFKSDNVKNAVWVQMPEKFGRWIIDNTNSDLKFPKYVGNFVDANVKNIKDVKKDIYKRYGSEGGAEVASVGAQ